MDVRFEQVEALHWLWLVAAVAGLAVFAVVRKRQALRALATDEVLPRLTATMSMTRPWWRVGLLTASMVLLVAALLDPRWGVSYRQVQQRGLDILVLLDVSKSMLAEDVRPNRLGRARQYVRDLVDELAGDRIGLITFAGAPSVRCPLTVDYGAFLLALDLVDVEDAPRSGTLLGDAIRLAGESFTDEVPDFKAVIILSDGEDHGSYPMEAAQRLHQRLNVPIFTIGIGDSDEGARIPVQVNAQQVYLTYRGEEVWSIMNPELLRELALATDGAYIPAGTAYAEMQPIYEQRMEPLARREFDAISTTYHHPQYQWFAGAALVLLLIETALSDRRAGRPTRSVELSS